MANRCKPSRPVPNLRRYRERAGLSQDELAYRASISQSKLSRVERGFLIATDVERDQLAAALGVTVDVLFGRVAQARG